MTHKRPHVGFTAMSRRDAEPEPTAPTPPADPERDEPSDDEQQPDPKPKAKPEGKSPKAPEPDEQPDADQADDDVDEGDDADKDDAADRAKDKGDEKDWKAEYDKSESKRRDFESRAATAENELQRWQKHATDVDTFWRRIVQKDAPELYERVMNEERAQQGKASERGATRDSSFRVIASVYRQGEKDFADFLTSLVEDGDVRVTAQNIERHRATFTRIKGGASNGNGNGAAATTSTPPSPPRRGDPSRPPKVPAGGRVPVGGDDDDDQPWKPGQPFDVRGNLTRGLKKSAEQRRRGR